MKLFKSLCFAVLASGLVMGQSNTANTSSASDTSNIADELKQLREAVAQQQKQIAQQQEHIQKLEQQLGTKQDAAATTPATTTTGSVSPRVIDASLRAPSSSSSSAQPVSAAQTQPQQPESQGAKSPLSFRIGAAEFTPGGFVDFENVFRSTNTGNVTATNFWLIPFSNTVSGHLTEYRSTGQYSRFNLKTTAKYGKNDITGYLEFDFNGNDAANVFVTSNPHTDRLRLYWLDLRRGKWEFLGGQTWGLLTPNRVGVSPNPADLSLTYGEDAQVHVGINYTRAAEFRAAYHFNDNFVWALGIENPDQFVGQGETIFPAAFNAQLGGQFDAANQATVPNVAPDIVSKLAFDDKFAGGRQLHFEVGGLFTMVKSVVLPTFTGATFHQQTAYGGGIQSALNFEIFHGKEGRNLRFVADGIWGPGVGRYLIGMAPQAVVRPEFSTISPSQFDAAPLMVHSGNALAGFEFLPHPKSQFGVYAGAVYAQRLAFPDITATSLPSTAVSCQPGAPSLKLPCIGFGGTNSPNSANRAIQEMSVDWTQTFWKNPQYGAVLLVTQASYVSRSPWFVAAGAPKNAHLGMGYVSLRYVLP